MPISDEWVSGAAKGRSSQATTRGKQVNKGGIYIYIYAYST